MKEQDGIIEEIASMLAATRDRGGTIYLIGNGGSASTAGHMAGDLTKTVSRSDKRGFKAVSLTDNVPTMMAWANDLSYDAIFEEQLKSFMTENDALIAISGSGNSKNIINAVKYANSIGACTIGLTGMDGGELAKIAKISFIVPDNSMYRIEDLHLMLGHVIAFRSANASTSHHSSVYAP
jgi:D-sedoheptulose 7-phosphate isomerase